MSKKPEKKRNKKFNPEKGKRLISDVYSRKYTISGVNHLPRDTGVFVMYKGVPVNITKNIAKMINTYKHKWTVCGGVFGRYKNGKVYVKYDISDATNICTAEQLSPLLADFVNDKFDNTDEKTRLSSFWLAVPDNRDFSQAEILLPLYYSCAWFSFLNSQEKESGVERGNHPPADITYKEFLEWFNANTSGRSDIKTLDIDFEIEQLGRL